MIKPILFPLCLSLLLSLLFSLFYFSPAIAADTNNRTNIDKRIIVANFSENNLENWEPHSFKGTTDYKLIKQDQITILKASSQNSASGLIKKQQIDLKMTPFMNWEWKVDKSLYRLSETFKEGDDFAARIYVVIDGGVFFWKTIALNYVWSSGQAKDKIWDNPFTSNAKMLAVESGDQFKKQWRVEKRNVFEDLKKAYGQYYRFIDAIAIMTDTDNSGQSVTAYYGDIYFSAD